mmetsp:Transcript_40392/g.94897  ORF Transcript_40392/g.94897 Transcript_40392/m.94897 type:complete len:209 (+) Transcript_40392:1332-1958(+)
MYLVKRKGEKKSRRLITSKILENELSASLSKNNTLQVCCAFGHPKVTAKLIDYNMIDSDREDELLLYSQKEMESPCKEVNGSDRRGLLSSKPIKGYEWVLNLVTNEESPFYFGLNDPMCKAISGEVMHGCLSGIYKDSIKNCTDMDKLTDCVLPNAEDTAKIVAIFSNPVHRSDCNKELPSRLGYPMVNGKLQKGKSSRAGIPGGGRQ